MGMGIGIGLGLDKILIAGGSAGSSLNNNLRHLWKLDDDPTWADSVGGADFSEQGSAPAISSVAIASGPTNLPGAVRTDNSSGSKVTYLEVEPALTTMFGSADGLTVSLWHNVNVGVEAVISCGEDTTLWPTNHRNWEYTPFGTTDIRWHYSTDGHPDESSAADTGTNNGAWMHNVFLWTPDSGGLIKIYQDATEVVSKAEATRPYAPGSNGGRLLLFQGGWFYVNAGQGANGDISQLAIWDRALKVSEITELYNGGLGLPYPW